MCWLTKNDRYSRVLFGVQIVYIFNFLMANKIWDGVGWDGRDFCRRSDMLDIMQQSDWFSCFTLGGDEENRERRASLAVGTPRRSTDE